MNFTSSVVPAGCSSMYVEVSHRPGEGYDAPARRAALLKKVRAGLEKAGILRKSDQIVVAHFLPIRYAYVIYDVHRTPSVKALLEWLKEKAHCDSIGRYGAWKYSFMEEAILDGKKTAEDLLRRL
jgi:protoporphyrinogen oxidase